MRLSLSWPDVHAIIAKNLAGCKAQRVLLVCGILWLSGVGAGLWVLWDYENRPGIAAHPPAQWPSASRMEPAIDRPTLVMLVHPHCSCTRASIGELAVLMAQTRLRPKTYVLFMKPPGFTKDWEKSSLWHSAAAIPHVTVVSDDHGLEASRFGAATSGQTILYSADGHLLFSGGITGSRGHAGDNAGRAAIVALLHREALARSSSFVFGCPLFTPGDPFQTQETISHVLTHD